MSKTNLGFFLFSSFYSDSIGVFCCISFRDFRIRIFMGPQLVAKWKTTFICHKLEYLPTKSKLIFIFKLFPRLYIVLFVELYLNRTKAKVKDFVFVFLLAYASFSLQLKLFGKHGRNTTVSKIEKERKSRMNIEKHEIGIIKYICGCVCEYLCALVQSYRTISHTNY